MRPEQPLKPNLESFETMSNYGGHTEQCGAFIGHPSEPCKRCGFGYYDHTG